MRKGKEPYARAENRMAKKMRILWMDEQLMRCMRERIQWRDGCQQLPHPSSGIEETGKHRIWSGLRRYCQCKSRELSERNENKTTERRDTTLSCTVIVSHLSRLSALFVLSGVMARALDGDPNEVRQDSSAKIWEVTASNQDPL